MFVPSTQVFVDLAVQMLEASDYIQTRSMQLIDGDIVSGDASHKVTKLVYSDIKDDRAFHGLYTLMNQHRQVRTLAATTR